MIMILLILKMLILLLNLKPPPHGMDSDGIPTCPRDPSLKMVYNSITREKGRAPLSGKILLLFTTSCC
ncbi:hypothetical protein FWJ32_10380 [Calorimonas adulescens]|uniref:Uncharacterized protein n=1 Tax=Calorimonas adulescens TaxID=2606906 RepID=A0A5D8Q983_9THEO|nr:hypothetical protein FWJ32_10380 [Calorimonas adulescens]